MKQRNSGDFWHDRRGFALVETLVAMGVIVITFGVLMTSMTHLNRYAAKSRVQTNARAILQRNVDRVLSERFTAQITPAILMTTSTGGSTWDDDGGGDNKVAVTIQDGTGTKTVLGTLTRTVTAIANSNDAVLRHVTFSLTYQWRGKNETYSVTTTRSRD